MLVFLRGAMIDASIRLTCYKSPLAFEDKIEEPYKAIRVYRLDLPDFTFNIDYKEFFDGLDYREGKLIFHDALECSNNRKFTFQDQDVTVGSTYAYWMADAEGEPIGPVPIKFRDPRIWWTYDRVKQRMEKLKDLDPQVEIETIGQTVRETPIRAIKIGRGKKCIALIGAVHAGESGAELMIPAFERLLCEEKELLSHVAIVAIPTLNIDERDRLAYGNPWYLRTNANGVDLNRNFPAHWEIQEFGYGLDTADPDSMTYRGPAPASEPETQAAMKWLRQQRPIALFNFHCLSSICGMSFLGSRFGGADENYVRRCLVLAGKYVEGMSGQTDRTNFLGFECSAGSLPAWACHQLNITALEFEISKDEKIA